jgi:hypothetical protein
MPSVFPDSLRPERRSECTDGPLAFPLALSELSVDAAEGSGQRDHRSDDVLGDCRLVTVGIGQMGVWPERMAIDPIQTRTRHLNQP